MPRRSKQFVLKQMACFLVIATLSLPEQGLGAESPALVRCATETAHDDVQSAIQGLQSGETCQLQISDVQLDAVLVVDSSEVTIRGADGGTKIRCPPQGGALDVRGSNVTLEKLIFTDCTRGSVITAGRIQPPLGQGELVLSGASDSLLNAKPNKNATLHIIDCHFEGNKAKQGTVITAESSSIRIERSSFNKNSADNDGGVFHLTESNVSISNCEFGNNEGDDGGVMFAYRSTVKISSSSFANNTAKNFGGVVRARATDVFIMRSNFSNNRARYKGGAIYQTARKKSVVEGSLFWNNTAKTSGGAIALVDSDLESLNSTFQENSAGRTGGAISIDASDASFQDTTFLLNRAEREGGAVWSDGDKVECLDSNFKNNIARTEGGALWNDGEKLKLVRVALHENVAGEDGGAVWSGASSLICSDSTFEWNWSGEDGAAIWKGGAKVEISNSTFRRNCASRNGGALWFKNVRAQADRSFFYSNKAREAGGAVWSSFGEVERRLSNFRNSSALEGGSVNMTSSRLELESSRFQGNNATRLGGAIFAEAGGCEVKLNGVNFTDNNATEGGALALTDGATLIISSGSAGTSFERNSAHSGGGLYCHQCGIQTRSQISFVQNAALKMGGAVYAVGTTAGVKIHLSRFESNVASYGGAVALLDAADFTLGKNNIASKFSKNIALQGGALYVKSKNAKFAGCEMDSLLFESNRALNKTALTTLKTPAVEHWKRLHDRAEIRDMKWLESLKCGRGGALYFDLSNLRNLACLDIHIGDTKIANNSAYMGGGVYVSRQWIIRHGSDAERASSDANIGEKECRGVRYSNVTITGNSADVAGGGMFVTDIANLSAYNVSGSILGVETNNEKKDEDVLSLADNNVQDKEGYGTDLATGASSLEFLNTDGSINGLVSDEKLTVKSEDDNAVDSDRIPYLRIAVKDRLNQRVTKGSSDSELVVVLDSPRISGKRKYRANQGMIRVNDTFVVGVDKSSTVRVQSDDDRRLSVSLNFSTVPCEGGALADKSGSSCFYCPEGHYGFSHTKSDCHPCEDHAVCTRTTVIVPESGYWHSSPFSPFIRRCLVKEACDFPDRTTNLSAYYNDSSVLARQLEQDFAGDDQLAGYEQCSEGYTGYICGSCATGYGHAAEGRCEACGQDASSAVVMSVAFVLILFGSMTIKLWISVSDIRTETRLKISADRTRVMSMVGSSISAANEGDLEPLDEVPEVEVESSSSSELAELQNQRSSLPRDRNIWRNGSARSNQHPLLTRSERIGDPSMTDDSVDTVSPQVERASRAFTDTYNILFNNFQLNSVMLMAEIQSTSVLRRFISIQAMAVRLFLVSFIPFDCSLSDRDRDKGMPNVLINLWFQTAFPVMSVMIYLVLIRFFHWLRSERRRSRYEVDAVPPDILIVLVIYLAYGMDIFANLLRVLHCVDASDSFDSDHQYANYEHTQSGWFWTGDTKLTCWKGAHLYSTVVACVGLAVLIGSLVFIVITLHRGKRRLQLLKRDFMFKYGILHVAYNRKGLALYWEVIIVLRKMLLVFVHEYGKYKEQSGALIGLSAAILFGFFLLHESVQPFDNKGLPETFPSYAGDVFKWVGAQGFAEKWVRFNKRVTLNGLEAMSLSLSLALILTNACTAFQTQQDAVARALLHSACFTFNAVFVGFMVYRLWWTFHHLMDVRIRENNNVLVSRRDADALSRSYLFAKIYKLLKLKRPASFTRIGEVLGLKRLSSFWVDPASEDESSDERV